MENGKKREWIKNAVIVFLIVMLILTLFSNTIMNYSLPEVAAQYCYSGQITNTVRGNGVVETDDPYKVEFKESRVIESVAVREGDYVEKDAVLYYLEAGDSEELATAIRELEALEDAYETQIITEGISREVTNAVNSGNIGSLESNQAKIEAAKNRVKSAQALVDNLNKEKNLFSENKAKDDASSALSIWEKQNLADNEALDAALGEYNTASEAKNSAQTEYDTAKSEYDEKYAQYLSVSGNDVSANEIDIQGAKQKLDDAEKKLKKAKDNYKSKESAYKTAKSNEAYSLKTEKPGLPKTLQIPWLTSPVTGSV